MIETTNLAGQIRRDLYAIVDNYDEALEPARRAAGAQVKATREPPLPIGAHILDARREAHTDLVYWARFLLDEVRDINGETLQHGPTTLDVGVLVPFVSTWADWLVTNAPDDADNLAADAAKHAKALRGIVAPERRDWMPLGRCPVVPDGEAEACGGQVRAYPDTERMPSCQTCRTEAVTNWWAQAMLADPDRLLTADELPAFLHTEFGKVVRPATVRKWIERKWIESSGRDEGGRTLYDRGAVAYALTRRAVLAA